MNKWRCLLRLFKLLFSAQLFSLTSKQAMGWGKKQSVHSFCSIFIFTLHFRACRSNLFIFFPIYLSPLCTCCCFWWKSHKEVDVNVSFIITCVHSIPVKRLEVNGWVDMSVGVWIDGSMCRWKTWVQWQVGWRIRRWVDELKDIYI